MADLLGRFGPHAQVATALLGLYVFAEREALDRWEWR
jgi:hypothetical protein